MKVKVKSPSKEYFTAAIDKLRTIPVISFVNDKESGDKYYKISIFFLDKLRKIAFEGNYGLYITDLVIENEKRLKIRFENFEKCKQDSTFESPFWTDDPQKKILPYQAQAVNICLRAKRYLVGEDLGLGKTIEAIGIICKAVEDGYERILVVCPNRIKMQWKSEILIFTKFKDEEVGVISTKIDFKCFLGKTDKPHFLSRICKGCEKLQECKEFKNDPEKRLKIFLEEKRILICNYEVMDKYKKIFCNSDIDVLILDEASRIKNSSTITFKAIKTIVDSLPSDSFVIPMSGTFIENKLEEIYPPLSLVNKAVVGEYHNFKNHYLIYDFWGNVTGYRNQKELKALIDNWIIRRSVDEVWKDRPVLIEKNVECEMTEKQRVIYEKAKEGVLNELKDKEKEGKINFAEIGALMNYLIQICDSAETVDHGVEESGKMETLIDIVSNEISSKHKILIFSFFANKMIPIIKREMSKFGKCLTITGGIPIELSERRKMLFKTRKRVRFLICSDSMAYGANLQEARYVINFDLPWNPAKLDQRIRRVYRRGQTHTVNVINLVTPNSVENRILDKLAEKRKLFDYFLHYSTLKKKSSLSLDDMLEIIKAKN
jgi:SNF2 family DNA or RNA helicase